MEERNEGLASYFVSTIAQRFIISNKFISQ